MRRPGGRRVSPRFAVAKRRQSIAQQFAALFTDGGTAATRDLRFEERYTSAGGVNVDSIDDWISNGATKLTITGTIPVPTPNALANNALTFRFNAGPYGVCNLTNAQIQFLSDNTDSEYYVVYNPKTVTGLGALMATTASGTQGGIVHYCNGANVRTAIYKTGGAVDTDRPCGSIAIDTPTYTGVRKIVASGFTHFQKSTTIISGAFDSAPVNEPSVSPLNVGQSSGGGQNLNAELFAIYGFRRALSTPDRATLRSYIQAKFGIPP